MLEKMITTSTLALAAVLGAAGEAFAASAASDTDWTQGVLVFIVAWIGLAVGIHLLTRRRRRSRTGFLSW